MSGQIFDIVNLFIAVAAFALAGLTAYWQHRKVDRLAFAVLNFGFANVSGMERQPLQLTFALANTGSLPEIVSSIWLIIPTTRAGGYQAEIGRGQPASSARMERVLVPAGMLTHGTAFFDMRSDEHTARNESRHIAVRLLIEMVNGRGRILSREIEGLKVIESDQGQLGGTMSPNGMTVSLLPKPGSDKSVPLGI